MAKNQLARLTTENQALRAEIARLNCNAANRAMFAARQSKDMACIALYRAFGFGETRQKRFGDMYDAVYSEYCESTIADYADDNELWYTKDKLDQELQCCCGKHFQPWEVRYKG